MRRPGGTRDNKWWWDPDTLRVAAAQHNYNMSELARQPGSPSRSTLQHAWNALGLPHPNTLADRPGKPDVDHPYQWALDALRTAGDHATIEQIADIADRSPAKVRAALQQAGENGYRVQVDDTASVRLQRVLPDTPNRLHPGLFDGHNVRFGVVSDTHLGSNHQALDELHLAYDMFAQEGLSMVLHAGDITSGKGIYRGQDSEIHQHTLDGLVGYTVDQYPRRDGVTTHLIGGNHDLEGGAGRVGLDVAAAVAARRDDINYLGPYSAWLGVGDDPDHAPWVHLLHGKGGMSYAYSYKAQKLVDGYPPGRKPAVLLSGHWHVRGQFNTRGVEVLFAACFEWQSLFLTRLGLSPAVGFHVVEATFGDDGSLVRWLARYYTFHAGRVVG